MMKIRGVGEIVLALERRNNKMKAGGSAGRLDQAVAVAEERLSQAPDSVVGRNLLGVIYNQQGKYDEAVAQFQQPCRLPQTPLTRLSIWRSVMRIRARLNFRPRR